MYAPIRAIVEQDIEFRPEETPLIAVKDVEKRYPVRRGEPVHALTDINLSVRQGEFLSIVGPSGCGKSTLMRILAGLDRATQGQVLIDGEPVVKPRPDVGIVFQQATLLPWRNVLDNVLLPAKLKNRDPAGRDERARMLLDLVSLSGFADKYPFELSGGMQQRVAICRALICNPKILLMDEPFGALDAMTREQMNVELMRIREEEKKTVIFITHSIPEAVFLSDRVVMMTSRPGRIAAVFDVDLPKPRTLASMGSPAFASLCNDIRLVFSDKLVAHNF